MRWLCIASIVSSYICIEERKVKIESSKMGTGTPPCGTPLLCCSDTKRKSEEKPEAIKETNRLQVLLTKEEIREQARNY
jgi:hypothetical protein